MRHAVIPHLYGLLYFDDVPERYVNLRAQNALATYALNAVTLAKSAEVCGQAFTLVTNDTARIERVLHTASLKGALDLREHQFSLDVPANIPFRSAHYKLELIRAFGTGDFGDVPALVDLDIVLLRALTLPDANAFYAYDISRQMWGAQPDPHAIDSLERLTGRRIECPRWFGGEFTAGPANLFGQLAEAIEPIWHRYIASGNLYHHGDEMVLSAALNSLRDSGFPLADAGSADLIARWWSRRTTNAMPPLDQALNAAVLHLPADKNWLAEQAHREFSAARFASDLRRRAALRLPYEQAKSFGERLLGRPRQLLPQLA